MTTEVPKPATDSTAHRRAADASALQFKEDEIKSLAARHGLHPDGEIETIDMDLVLPPGSDDDFQKHAASTVRISPQVAPEQKKLRLKLAIFKQTFEEFKVVGPMPRVGIADLKRGDVLAIKTIVGTIYVRIIDRIKGERTGAGEVLCECHYDLVDLGIPPHAASIQLPICASNYTITNPDGSKRLASRKLKLTTEAELPAHVANLLDERFFVSFSIHASPQTESLRVIDAVRWLTRIGVKIKRFFEENNRREREKKQQKEDEIRRRQEEKERKKEEKRAAAEAKKNKR